MHTALLIAFIAALQTVPAAAPQAAGLVEDAGRLTAATTNEARFDALTSMLRNRGLTFAVEPFTIEKPIGREPRTEGRNVVVTVGDGTDVIVIGAHYDAARLADGSLSRGAVDNAASSVMLVRVAEALRTEKLGIRVRIVWFDMEELGLLGSAQYLKQHASERFAAMLNFDVNGYGNSIVFGPSESAENATLRRAFVETCAAENVNCVGFAQMPPGDDRSFVKAGVPTISIGIIPAVEAHQLWLMMNAGANSGLAPGTVPSIMKTLHTTEDTQDKLSEETMSRMQRFALSLVRSVARR
jgi:Zn-dependent M28 family amino/carboxypeptidase